MGKSSCLAFVCAVLVATGCGGSDDPSGSGGGGSGGTGGDSGIGGAGMGGDSGMGGAGMGGGEGACIPGASFNPGADPNPLTPGQLCDRLAQIQCAAERCCCPDGNAQKYPDEATCVATQTALCTSVNTEDVANSPVAGFDVDAANAAFAEFKTLAATCDLGITQWGVSPDGFASAIAGTLSNGATCWETDLNQMQGQIAASLASCGSSNACMADGTLINPLTTQEWHCGPRRSAGQTCLADPTCADGLYCNNPPDSAATPPRVMFGSCAARKPSGPTSSCTLPTECESLFCVGGACVEATRERVYCLDTAQ